MVSMTLWKIEGAEATQKGSRILVQTTVGIDGDIVSGILFKFHLLVGMG